jgi:hypothetical protein
MIFADNDGWKCPDDRGGKWHGAPISFHAKPEDKITILVYDLCPGDWSVGPITLHRADGKRVLLLSEREGQSEADLDNSLFENGPPGPDAKRNKVVEESWVIKEKLP